MKEILKLKDIEKSLDIYKFVVESCEDYISKGYDSQKVYCSDCKRFKRVLNNDVVMLMLNQAKRSLHHYNYLKENYKEMNKDFYDILLACANFRDKYGIGDIGAFDNWATFNNIFATKHTKEVA